MNSEGEMLWERYFYDAEPVIIDMFGNPYVSGGQFYDVEELENGDLAVVGSKITVSLGDDGFIEREQDLWLLRLNADGCIGDYCGESPLTVVTDVEEVGQIKDIFSVYPNPASTSITVDSKEKLELMTLSGESLNKFLITKGENVLDISDLSSGIYILRSLGKEQSNVVKFVKS